MVTGFCPDTEAQNIALADLPKVIVPQFKKDTFNIIKYGAKVDLIILNSEAITKAIDACSEAGGGTVLIPPGFWLTGPLELKSNVNLHLQKGALLQFSDNFNDYPLVKTTYEGLLAYRCKAPIYAIDVDNIAITGEGVMDGAGGTWRPVKREKMTGPQWERLLTSGGLLNAKKTSWYPSQKSLNGSKVKQPGVITEGMKISDLDSIKDFLRPNMVSITNCKNVLLEGVTFLNSPAWCLHPLLCEHITLKNLIVQNPWYAQNGDGVDLESCKNAVIENCSFDVGDDGMCIKSGRDEQGRKRGRPTENVIIKNCVVNHGHGGFVIGSEMSGGIRNMYVSNCTFIGTDIGIRFKTQRGRGGLVENIHISDINMTNIAGDAILFDMYYGAKDPIPLTKNDIVVPDFTLYPVTEATPEFKSVFIKNVECKGAARGIFIQGLPEMNVKDIHLENIFIQADKGMLCIEGEDIFLKNVTLLSKENTVLKVENSKRVSLDGIHCSPNTEVLLKISGNKSDSIKLVNTDTSNAKKEVEFSDNVPTKVLLKK